MRNKYVFVSTLLVVLTVCSVIISNLGGNVKTQKDELLVVTSFYPVYIAALNVTDGIEGVNVKCLSKPTTGCVHDHQLTTEDMILLEQADVLVVNGAGMESYLESVIERFPKMDIIDTSVGTTLLDSEGGHAHAHAEESEEQHEEEKHEHEEEHEEAEEDHTHEKMEEEHEQEEIHEEHTDNSHIWMDMENYCIQTENISSGLIKIDAKNQTSYEENTAAYQKKVRALLEEVHEIESETVQKAVSTHEAFSYFVENFHWEITATINMDENTTLKALEVSEVIHAVEEEAIPYVFTEEIYGSSLSKVLEEETSAKTVVLDTLVMGSEDKDAYLKGMKQNLKVLKEAVQ